MKELHSWGIGGRCAFEIMRSVLLLLESRQEENLEADGMTSLVWLIFLAEVCTDLLFTCKGFAKYIIVPSRPQPCVNQNQYD